MNTGVSSPKEPVRILIVEDSATQAALIEQVLQSRGYLTQIASDGDQALSAICLNRPNIVISDIMMPVMDGLQLCRAIKQDPELFSIPVILLTSLSETRDLLSALEAGADFHIPKPFHEDYLVAKITEILSRRVDRMSTQTEAEVTMILEGKSYRIQATREHVLRLLLSTYEVAIMQNQELLKAKEDLLTSQRQLVRSERLIALGRVVGGVAHELNNPLMGVLNYVQYCIERTGEDDPRHSRLEKAIREMERCIRIVSTMLSTSRIVTNDDVGEVAPLDCRGVITNAVDILQEQFRAGGIEVELNIEADMPAVLGDSDHLMQVVLNLLTNARDAVAESDRKKITIRSSDGDGAVAISVSDTGSGMPDEVLDHIFDPFFTTKDVGEGMGLGMPLSRSLVEQMGGTIEVESQVGEGTTVTMRFPVDTGAAPAVSTALAA